MNINLLFIYYSILENMRVRTSFYGYNTGLTFYNFIFWICTNLHVALPQIPFNPEIARQTWTVQVRGNAYAKEMCFPARSFLTLKCLFN